MKFVDDVRRFHEKFEIDYEGPPRLLPADLGSLRYGRLLEEVREYGDATQRGDLVATLDALVDLVYVAAGAVVQHGLVDVFDEAWRRVHEANLKKERAAIDGSNSRHGSAGDVIKPEGWEPPRLEDLIEYGWPPRCLDCGTDYSGIVRCDRCEGGLCLSCAGIDTESDYARRHVCATCRWVIEGKEEETC
jgi:predicted HAD superfamily Cof-like phosphohydrolase